MIDIHAHILPGLDDGAESLDEALQMAEIAVRSGTTAMACTVHSNQMGRFENFESEMLKDIFRELVTAVKKEKIPLTLVRGMEIYASDDMTEKIRSEKMFSLNRSGNYLMEFGFDESPVTMREQIQEMIRNGYQPVIAHPERYFCVQENPNYLYEWLEMGAYSQLNKASIFGRFGREEARTAEILLDHRMVTCVASDTHGPDFRTPDMIEMERYLQQYYSDGYCELLLQVNPSRILMGKQIITHEPPVPVERSRRFF